MMMADYNLDAIPDSIFDNIIIDNSLNMDEIFDVGFTQIPDLEVDELLKLSSRNMESGKFEVDVGSVVQAQEAGTLHPQILQHDCMWSGTCQDESHPCKPKNKKFSVQSVCREFEKELGWTSSSESETDDDLIVEEDLEKNMPTLFPTIATENLSPFLIPPPPLPSQLVSKINSQAVPRYNPLPLAVNQTTINQSVELIRNHYVLPPSTTIQGPHLTTQYQLFKPDQQVSYLKIEKQEQSTTNVIKFIPKAPSCVTYQLKNPTLSQHNITSQIKVEPLYIFNTESIDSSQPMFLNYGSTSSSTQSYLLTANEPNKDSKKRKAINKPPKKSVKKMKLIKEPILDSQSNYMMENNPQKPSMRKYGSDNDDPSISFEKRNMHNNMERQRRIGMRNLFVELKKAIPTLDDRERVPKVNILKEAISYCGKVQKDEHLLAELKRKHNRLKLRAKKLGFSPNASIGSSTSSASSSYTTGGDEDE